MLREKRGDDGGDRVAPRERHSVLRAKDATEGVETRQKDEGQQAVTWSRVGCVWAFCLITGRKP